MLPVFGLTPGLGDVRGGFPWSCNGVALRRLLNGVFSYLNKE